MRWVKPLDLEAVSWAVSNHSLVVTVEENTARGGFGAAVLESMSDLGLEAEVLMLAVPDCFVTFGAMSKLLDEVGLTPEGVRDAIVGRVRTIDVEDAAEELGSESPQARHHTR
jgi:1-deoxy-D-xylulose-5-phosphate synthase